MAVGSAYSVTEPNMVIRPILLAGVSVNHIAPSGPFVITEGLFALGMGYSVNEPDVVIRPIFLPRLSVNQSAPSGPVVIT